MPVVVTGAAGFIGRHVVTAMRGGGHEVVAVDRRPVEDLGAPGLAHDLVDRHDDVRTALAEADAVLHLAGRPGVRDRDRDVERWRWHDNVLAGEAVLADTPARTPVVVASSSSVYGGAVRRHGRWLPCHEEQPLAPRGGYARSKVVLEQRCEQRRTDGGHVTVVRPFTVAGEGQRPDMALSTWLGQARSGQPLTVLGSPARRRDVTDVRDVVAGLVRALEVAPSSTINLGTGTTHSLDQLTRAVTRALGMPHVVEVRGADPVEVPVTRADTRRCAGLLGLRPRTDLDALVRRQAAASAAGARPHLLLHTPSPELV